MPIKVFPIAEENIPGAVKCIQDACVEDPYNRWVFHPKENFNKDRNTASLAVRCRWGMKHALFHVAQDTDDPSGKVLGVACWLPPVNPSAPPTWNRYFGDWWLWLEQIKVNLWHGRGGLDVKRYHIWKAAQAEAQAGLWDDVKRYHIWKAAQAEAQAGLWDDDRGYYFCNIVTVLPEAQGKGIGKLLFNHVTDQADREGRKCYLESSRAEPNMAIYRSMGFELAREMICDDDGDAITLYCMMREPQDRQGHA